MKKSSKTILTGITSLVAPCVVLTSISSINNDKTALINDDKNSTNPVDVGDTVTAAIPITNHITNNQNIGSFWTAPTENDVISKLNQLKGQSGVSASLEINEIYVQTLPTPSGTTNVTAVIGVQPWSEYYQTDSVTNVIYNINPDTFKSDLSSVVASANRWVIQTDDPNVFNTWPTADELWPLIMAKIPSLNRNQLQLDMSNQKTQQVGGGCYVYLKPSTNSTQYKGSVQIFYGMNVFQSAGFTIVGESDGYTANDSTGVLTFTKSGEWEVSNNYLPDTTTLITKHRIVINDGCSVNIRFNGNVTMNESVPISMNGTATVHLYSDAVATINCNATNGNGIRVTSGQTLILDGDGKYNAIGTSINAGIGSITWGEIQIVGNCSVAASHPSTANTYPQASIGGDVGVIGTSKIYINTTGRVDANGVSDWWTNGCAGIGAGSNNSAGNCWGTIIIDNGTIYAAGYARGAGIGTGTQSYNGSGGSVLDKNYGVIQVNGGSLHVKGGNSGTGTSRGSGVGAGIGFGNLRASNTSEITGSFLIEINGGTHYISGYGGCDTIGFGLNMDYSNKEEKRAEFIKLNGGTINPYQ